jgi:Flp pilus assembly protein TadB
MRAADPDLPRAVRKGPPITLTCECGEKREVRYGESWQCEGCGRSFDTRRIPLEEYAAIRRSRVRDRLLPAAVLLLVAGVALAFVLSGRWPAAVVIVPLSGFVWSTFVRPARRRRQYRAIAERPRWEINSD